MMIDKVYCDICNKLCDQDFVDVEIYKRHIYTKDKIIMSSKHLELCPECYGRLEELAKQIKKESKRKKPVVVEAVDDD